MRKINCMMGLFVALLCACSGNRVGQTNSEVPDSLYLLVGSYASPDSQGIKVYRFSTESGELQYISGLRGISNPSYLAVSRSGSRIYAVGEDEDTTATANFLSFDSEKGSLTVENSQPALGGSPCYIALDPDERHVLTANYFGGNITVFPLDSAGRLSPGRTVAFSGSSVDPERQTHPYLHCVYFTPDGRYLLANDLGTDRIHVFPAGGDAFPDEAAMRDVCLRPGSGPRHACFAPDGRHAYLVTELSGEVVTLSYDGRSLDTVQCLRADTLGARGSADIHISPDGRFVYASNRLKGDGIAIFSVDSVSGMLTKVGYQPTAVHPRNFVLSPDGRYLLVACRDENVIQLYARNPETGLLVFTGKAFQTPQPVCLKFILPA